MHQLCGDPGVKSSLSADKHVFVSILCELCMLGFCLEVVHICMHPENCRSSFDPAPDSILLKFEFRLVF